ncbi:Sodium/calcium exchanger 3 [Trichinella pseudospiralis]|uniref:Sodium/calcium exchanger 3 n=4 Tax=Trichinella pseudospiralis TaxID=6337 RepID=A0A0V1J1J5_TRIPS|nr:Sodium/calcium exchanger 3 [Trichinella pseudospiralis]KRZ43547.1 Sodium/calcium exchanger 3 [Trichinella pseudospiralis]
MPTLRWIFYLWTAVAWMWCMAEASNCSSTTQSLCKEGLLIPLWQPSVEQTSMVVRVGRALVYLCALVYMFLGVSIAADRFMAAIEVITSQERTVSVRKKDGTKVKLTVRVWNETVSNLTLMALGSSAPEILLSLIEICGNGFQAGDLGPNTIVGSAAFNLFMIIAICVAAIPNAEVRRQQHLNVFLVTALWSVFAYIWLYLILAVFSPGVIEVWEGFVTFLFFPLTVTTAFMADKKMSLKKFVPMRYRADSHGLRAFASNRRVSGSDSNDQAVVDALVNKHRHMSTEDEEFEQQRRDYLRIFRDLRQSHPDADIVALQDQAACELMKRAKKSRAFYRVQAIRRITGGGDLVENSMRKVHQRSMANRRSTMKHSDLLTCKVFFNPCHYTVLENVGIVRLRVERQGGPPDVTILVDYRTEDGTANAGSDYESVSGTLIIESNQQEAFIEIKVIDDDVFEEDEHFYVFLENLKIRTRDGFVLDPSALSSQPIAKLITPSIATVMILDDDHAGVFTFEKENYEVPECRGHVSVTVLRNSGCRGRVLLPYRTIDGTGKANVDYESAESELLFENEETQKTIEIGIINKEQYERSEFFQIEILQPVRADKTEEDKLHMTKPLENGSLMTDEERIAELGKPTLGSLTKCTVRIKESREFRGAVDMLIKKANVSLIMGTTTWREQFCDAFSLPTGKEDEMTKPNLLGYAMHFVSAPWKILCAFMPPTEYWNGWACFIVSIILIGLITALIGDLANHFGCTIGLMDAVTAITFVAIGTSVPDTFASHVSAVQDSYADSSIGNVTGSNAVNVFLGIGIAWTVAAVYHSLHGQQFQVQPGTLAFSVTIYCIEATICIAILVARRSKPIGGELGGPLGYKIATVLCFISLWILYVLLSSLESYCIITGF